MGDSRRVRSARRGERQRGWMPSFGFPAGFILSNPLPIDRRYGTRPHHGTGGRRRRENDQRQTCDDGRPVGSHLQVLPHAHPGRLTCEYPTPVERCVRLRPGSGSSIEGDAPVVGISSLGPRRPARRSQGVTSPRAPIRVDLLPQRERARHVDDGIVATLATRRAHLPVQSGRRPQQGRLQRPTVSDSH